MPKTVGCNTAAALCADHAMTLCGRTKEHCDPITYYFWVITESVILSLVGRINALHKWLESTNTCPADRDWLGRTATQTLPLTISGWSSWPLYIDIDLHAI